MRMPSCARGSRSHDGKRNYAIVQFLLQTGLQLDECSQLMLSDRLDMLFQAGALVEHKDIADFLLFGASIPLCNRFVE